MAEECLWPEVVVSIEEGQPPESVVVRVIAELAISDEDSRERMTAFQGYMVGNLYRETPVPFLEFVRRFVTLEIVAWPSYPL